MKILTTFVVAFIIGYLFGAYSSFSILVDFTSETAKNLFDESIQELYTGDNQLVDGDFDVNISSYLDQQKEKLINNFNEEVAKAKENLYSQLRNYLQSKIDELFTSSEN
ncbi:hypothetical protein [Candidatus Vampirococcus lugosii]|uniref:Uncharacterized protein n=1 Tax=Candidatus Vampirococcus lugosii TaxID=2789015 RepID=A0ABS5QKC8_9BACT|nr:hypothetical protein [Candidatus Vampirococcus lugosii]MBS8121695.1 hypothetical protein [Candidatus Vampirococcus lugosii]